ncbi:hypothetical protein BKA62DRAFT_708863 [Auriculariales sp. MPI-PUGE-AT-0066]|nr:hypothetical protein BKA62DRAFT_708863 [Auriculariales sp. MPI-PUGE-AT-0066]
MLFHSLAAVTLAAVVAVCAAPSPEKHVIPLPNPAQIWVFVPTFTETEAWLFKTGQAWHWADENGDPGAPAIANFTLTVVPGSKKPSGDDLLLKLSVAGKKCRFVKDILDCTGKHPKAPEAIVRGKVLTDANGDTAWHLLVRKEAHHTGTPSWSVTRGDGLVWNVSKNSTVGIFPVNLWLSPVA